MRFKHVHLTRPQYRTTQTENTSFFYFLSFYALQEFYTIPTPPIIHKFLWNAQKFKYYNNVLSLTLSSYGFRIPDNDHQIISHISQVNWDAL